MRLIDDREHAEANCQYCRAVRKANPLSEAAQLALARERRHDWMRFAFALAFVGCLLWLALSALNQK